MQASWESWRPAAGEVTILEARPGRRRRELLEQALRRAEEESGARTWLLECDFRAGGVWSGAQELLASVLAEIRRTDESLVLRHDYELLQVLPELSGEIPLRFPTLTDLAVGEEKVRGYPADRVFRSLHGLIDLLAEWKARCAPRPWVIACDALDAASRIGLEFFSELARRRGRTLDLSLIVAVSPGSGERFCTAFAGEARRSVWACELPPEAEAATEALEISQLRELDRAIGNDRVLIRKNLARMIRRWELAGDRERVLKWKLLGLEVTTDGGLYEDACFYGEQVRSLARELRPEDGALRWMIFFKLFSCRLALRDTEAAVRLAQEDALGRTERPEWRAQLAYMMAMLYARYLPEKDFGKAESYLEMGLAELEQADLSEADRQFRIVFNRNGLAMVRHFQRRYGEAIDLCRESFDRLSSHLGGERHRLHRSVLLFNLGQVYATLGRSGEAIAHYSQAIAMDPNYSEYYNDRGSLFLKEGAVEAALEDYERAIELSPPYLEVFTNLGQCHRRMGSNADAIEAYSRALDLEPRQTLALLGRAQAREESGLIEEAIGDYTSALRLEPEQWEALANRAALLYQSRRFEASLEDLDRALELAPDQADLYPNRALVLADLGRRQEAALDLGRYLALRPAALDRSEIEERLALLGSPSAPYVATAGSSASQGSSSTT